jgi:hypothetical protein
MSLIEALYIFDESNILLLSHVWAGRPPSAAVLLPLYLAHAPPRPSLIYAPSTNPPALLHAVTQDRLLFLAPTSTDADPLVAVEFLHRVADALEDFLGSPLLGSKITGNYDVVAQLLPEMCDAGLVATTEPNALRDVVDVPRWTAKMLGLPTVVPGLASAASAISSQQSRLPNPLLAAGSLTNAPAIPWRRTNVRHTSNELYVDAVEELHVLLAPSGLPLRAVAHGSLVFTAKVSGVPELLLSLSTPRGSARMQLPVFHPCVRLSRWRERPGELSFVPPDGRFLLMAYETDLLADGNSAASAKRKAGGGLALPASVSVSVSAPAFSVHLNLHPLPLLAPAQPSGFSSSSLTTAAASAIASSPSASSAGSRAASGTSAAPSLSDVLVRVRVPAGVRSLGDLRPTRGTARWAPGDEELEWRVGARDVAALLGASRGGGQGATAVLRCEVVGAAARAPRAQLGEGALRGKWEYDVDGEMAGGVAAEKVDEPVGGADWAGLMPTSASVSFTVKGWLASGVRVEKLALDAARSRGLGAGVQPYKGVKYMTVSKGGVETRC